MATNNQLSLTKRLKYAWAQYYSEINNNHQQLVTQYQQQQGLQQALNNIDIPQHITNEIQEMCNKLKLEIQCPICLEIIDGETKKLSITGCGHKYCSVCLQNLKLIPNSSCSICRKKL